MQKFILKVALFSMLVGSSLFAIFSQADGTTDAMYLKFTTPRQTSLIIGSSRAAQGIQPKELKEKLKRNDIYNFAFQLPTSPYGEVYFRSIQKKIDKESTEGIFILDVNPWTLAHHINQNSDNNALSETDKFLDKTSNVSLSPNVEYLMESYGSNYMQLLADKYRKGDYQTLFVEEDGWLHVTIESDIISTNKRTALKIERYKGKLPFYNGISQYRKSYLIDLIKFLKEHGKVYLVRIPVIQEMLEIENQLLPDFDIIIDDISETYDVQYINMMPDNANYTYTDGNHLDVASGQKFSIDLANRIKDLQD